MAAEEGERLLHVHVQHVGDGLAFVLDCQRLAIEAPAATLATGHPDIREEVHLDAELAVALAGFAAATLEVEAEAVAFVAARARLGEAGKHMANVVEEL